MKAIKKLFLCVIAMLAFTTIYSCKSDKLDMKHINELSQKADTAYTSDDIDFSLDQIEIVVNMCKDMDEKQFEQEIKVLPEDEQKFIVGTVTALAIIPNNADDAKKLFSKVKNNWSDSQIERLVELKNTLAEKK